MTNAPGQSRIFIPTNTATEWSEFRLHYPAGLALENCCRAIGESYQGGKVFYVNGDCSGGLIAALSDSGNPMGTVWGCYGTNIPGADATTIGTGHQNTHDMVAAGCSAALTVHDQLINGYSDWYLPSLDEWVQLYAQRAAVGGFSNFLYWTSTEYSSIYAYVMDFMPYGPPGSTGGYEKNGSSNPVLIRAIRSF